MKGNTTAQAAAWVGLNEQQSKLWTPLNMGGAEYERGGFHASVAHWARKGGLIAKTFDKEISLSVFPSHGAQEDLKLSAKYQDKPFKVSTLRTDWKKRYAVGLPEDAKVKLYVIAPSDKMPAMDGMFSAMRLNFDELSSHRGFTLPQVAAYSSLTDEDRAKLPDHMHAYADRCAWFDLASGVFITTDKNMFEKAKAVMGAKTEAELTAEKKNKMRFNWTLPGFNV